MAAAAAMNVGLWVLWHRLDFGFWDHPQLWLIPVGLCVLVAEYLNHDRLSDAQSAGIRYLALATIYVSSTAEHLRLLGESVWLPMALVVLSLVGIFAGVLLRIQSFLSTGVTFLLLVIGTMIYYAYFHQSMIFWFCCIALGVGIIAAVGFYEKRRERVRAAVKQFRAWQP